MTALPTITTDRLTLRPLQLDDAPAIQSLAGDRAISDTTLSIPHPYPDGLAEKWIPGTLAEWEEQQSPVFAITRNEDQELIGVIGLEGPASNQVMELGYWIAVHLWNQGFATEAGEAVLEFGFTQLNLQRIHAIHLTRNPMSGRVLKKIGMKHEGSRRKHLRKNDVLEDIELYGILRDQWQANQP